MADCENRSWRPTQQEQVRKKQKNPDLAYRHLLSFNKTYVPFYFLNLFFSSRTGFLLSAARHRPFQNKSVIINDSVDFAKRTFRSDQTKIFFVGLSDRILQNSISKAFQLGSYIVWYFLPFFPRRPPSPSRLLLYFFIPLGSWVLWQYGKSMCI